MRARARKYEPHRWSLFKGVLSCAGCGIENAEWERLVDDLNGQGKDLGQADCASIRLRDAMRGYSAAVAAEVAAENTSA